MLSVFTQETEEQRRLLGILQCATVEDVNRISEEIMSLQAFEDDDQLANRPPPGSIRSVDEDDVDDEAGYHNQEPVVCISNGAWINESFRIHPSSQQILETVYKSPIRFVDLQGQKDKVADEINAWVENATRGLMQEVATPESIETEDNIVLANTLYFKARWYGLFGKAGPKDFHLLNGQTVSVPFMTLDEHIDYGAFDGFSILELPYLMAVGKDGNSFSMYIFLPDERDGLPKLIQKMGCDPAFLNQKFELKREEFEYLYLPKFRFSYSFKPHATLKQLGHGFELGGRKSTMIQKVSIDVNEVGTEGAVATVFVGMGCGQPDPKVKFLADHPFLFMVREQKSRHVLFVGNVLDPSREA